MLHGDGGVKYVGQSWMGRMRANYGKTWRVFDGYLAHERDRSRSTTQSLHRRYSVPALATPATTHKQGSDAPPPEILNHTPRDATCSYSWAARRAYRGS